MLYLFESKIYLLAIIVSILILLLKKKMNYELLGIYFIVSLLGLKTIHCFINGNCYKEVWYFILIYIFINIVFVGFNKEFKKKLPQLTKKIDENKKDNNNFRESILKNTNADIMGVIKKKYYKKI